MKQKAQIQKQTCKYRQGFSKDEKRRKKKYMTVKLLFGPQTLITSFLSENDVGLRYFGCIFGIFHPDGRHSPISAFFTRLKAIQIPNSLSDDWRTNKREH